ncbi:retention module-containing protein [Congregibacter sp.]|uniref:retention module-containing protein n=1 Tax=Congregibacter sp. TaxID=2744308 RepID=UPI003F6D24FF
MAQAIGTVDIREGKVFARSPEGALRELNTGDTVFEGEVLAPATGAVAELLVPDMPSIQLADDQEMLLNGELLAETADSASEAAVQDPTIAAVVEALEGDGDILDNLEAPAAGGPEDEGSSFVRLGRIGFDLPEFASLRAGPTAEELAPSQGEADNDLQLLAVQNAIEPDDQVSAPPVVETPPDVTPDPAPEPEPTPEPEPEPPVDQPPVAVDDEFAGGFGLPLTGNVLSNDSDPEGTKLTVTETSEPANGTVSMNADGTFDYTPNDGFSGEDSFTYVVTDEGGNTSQATVTLVIDEDTGTPPPPPPPPPVVNEAPTAVDDLFATAFEAPLSGNVLPNDSDPEGDALTVTGNTDPANGSVTVNADGTFSYAPNDGFSGSDTFTYTVTDGNGNTDIATVTVNVADEPTTPPPPPAENLAPFAGDDSASLTEDTAATITVLTNDSDSDGTLVPGSVSIVNGPSNGSVTVNPDGTVTYTPDDDYDGLDSFTYTVTDDDGLISNAATVGLTISNAREIAQFTDNWVNGVTYTTYDGEGTVTGTGLTGDQGTPGSFSYEDGERIVFTVGDVIVGDFGAGNVPETGILFIHDIAGLSLANSNDQYVENTAIFLQALDADLTDGDLSDGLQTNAVINREEAFENGINITAETRAAFEGYVNPDTGEQLNLMDSWKNQISDALDHVGIEFTRQSEADPDGQFPFENTFESEAIDHVIETIRDDAVGGDREPEAFDERLSDVIEADGGVITYFSNLIDMNDPEASSIDFSAEGLLANAIPQQSNLAGLEVEIAEGTAAFVTRADGTKVAAGTIVYDDETRTGSIELDSDVISNEDVASGILQSLEFGYTIWDWTANLSVTVQPLDLFEGKIIADPGDVPEDAQYNQFVMTHSLAGDLKAEDGSFFQSEIFTTDQDITFKFTPEVFGSNIAEYADDFIVPVEYSTDGGATWQVMAQVGTYQLPGYQPILPTFGFTWSAGTEEVLVRIPIFDDPFDEQPNADGPDGQGIEIIDITVEGENFFTENLQPGIIDNDPSVDLPLVDIDFVAVGEGDGVAILTLSLDRPAVGDVSIDWSTASLGAIAGQDFEAVSGTAIILEGQTSVQISVPIIDDLIVEDTEFALVNLTGVSGNAVIADPQGTIRIFDNDGLSSTFSVADVSVTEGDEAVVTITRPGDNSLQQTVSIASLALAAGTDSASADDFTALGLTTLTFAAGQETATVRIPTTSDAIDEINETFRVQLSDPTNGSVIDGAAQVATVTILDDDSSPDGQDLDAQNSVDDQDVSVDISGNFTDVDSTLTFSATGLPTGLSIDEDTGVISGTIDNSASQGGVDGVYTVEVTATDGVNPAVSESFEWTVTNPGPDFVNETSGNDDDTYSFELAEGALLGATVGTAGATDLDGDTLTYSITSGNGDGYFAINSETGEITVTQAVDDALVGDYTLDVLVDDGEGGTDTATVNIALTNVDDPLVVAAASNLEVDEDTLVDGIDDNETDSIDLSALVSGGDGDYSYSIVGTPTTSPGTFTLVGSTLTFELLEAFDHADGDGENTAVDAQSVTIEVSDGAGRTQNVTVNVDVVDGVPQFTNVADPDSDGIVGLVAPNVSTTYTQQFADWDFGADGSAIQNPDLATVSGNVQIKEASATQVVLELLDSDNETVVGELTLNAAGDDSLEVFEREPTISEVNLGDQLAEAGGPVSSLEFSGETFSLTVTGSDGVPGVTKDDAVNASSQGWGVSNQNLDTDETLIFSFDTGVETFSFSTEKFAGSGTTRTIGVKVTYAEGGTEPLTLGPVTAGQVVKINELGGFDSTKTILTVEVTNTGAGSLNLNTVTVGETVVNEVPTLDFQFSLGALAIEDQDGDTAEQTFNVRLDGSSTGTFSVDGVQSPIAIDLDNDGLEYLSRDSGVVFTDESTGESVNTAWVAPDDGLLVVDANRSGTVDDSKEYVFTEWSETAETDMEAVAEVFDTNQDGVLDAQDEQFDQFAVWQDADSDGVTDEGELTSLVDLGVESISLNYNEDSQSGTAAEGDVIVHGQSDLTWQDGSVSLVEDTSFSVSAADVLVDDGDVILPAGEEDSTETTTVVADAAQPTDASNRDADAAALEIDLLLNTSSDDKLTPGGTE